VSEDTSAAAITGDTIANLFAGNFSDPNDQVNNASITATGGTSADSFWGVAITNLSVNSAQGEWQYSTDGGTTWAAIGSTPTPTPCCWMQRPKSALYLPLTSSGRLL
jgi:hypothetical protein